MHTYTEFGTQGDSIILEEQLNAQRADLDRTLKHIAEYEGVQKRIEEMMRQPRAQVLSALGPMAYVDAEISNTNSYLVLLGNNYFAVRSAAQTSAVCQRRVAFLRTEQTALAHAMRETTDKLAHATHEALQGPAAAHEPADMDRFEECDLLTPAEIEVLEEELMQLDDEMTEEAVLELIRERQRAKRDARLEAERQADQLPVLEASPVGVEVSLPNPVTAPQVVMNDIVERRPLRRTAGSSSTAQPSKKPVSLFRSGQQ